MEWLLLECFPYIQGQILKISWFLWKKGQDEKKTSLAVPGEGWVGFRRTFLHRRGGKALEWDGSLSLEMSKECLDLGIGHRLGSDPRGRFPPKQFPNSGIVPPFPRKSMCACVPCPLSQLIPNSSRTKPMENAPGPHFKLFLKILCFFTFSSSNRHQKNSGGSGPVQLEKSKRAPGFPGSSFLIFRGLDCLCSLCFHENDVFIKAEKWTLGLMGSADFPRPPAGMGVPGNSPALILG